MINIPLAVAHLLPNALYRDGSRYERLVATWFDERPVPTEAELDAAWTALLAERDQAEARAQQRVQNMSEVVGTKVDDLLTEIDAGLATLANSPTNAQVINILERQLQLQKKELRALRDVIITLAAQAGLPIDEEG